MDGAGGSGGGSGSRLRILFEDEHCLAISKPAGQFTQGTWAPAGEETLEQAVRSHLRPDAPSAAYVGIVHRLDRPVSGVLVWAKTRKAARRLSRQFERRRVVKEYWAVVEVREPRGHWGLRCSDGEPFSETWTDVLGTAGVEGVVPVVPAGEPSGRSATTRVEWVELAKGAGGLAWLRLWPVTGRTHQLRVQSAHRGLPVVGDSTYGAQRSFPQGIALHARSVAIWHPSLETMVHFTAPLPESWRELASEFGREVADHWFADRGPPGG